MSPFIHILRNPRQYARPFCLWTLVVISLGLITGVAGGVFYIQSILPTRICESLHQAPWARLNVNENAFNNMADFKVAESALIKLKRQPNHQHDPIPSFLLAELYRTINNTGQANTQYYDSLRLMNRSWYHQNAYRQLQDEAHAALALNYYIYNRYIRAQAELRQIQDNDKLSDAELSQALSNRLDNPNRADFHLLLAQELRDIRLLPQARQELGLARDLSQNPQLRLNAIHYQQSQMPQHVKELSPMARYYGLVAERKQYEDENLQQAAMYYDKAIRETPKLEWNYLEQAMVYRGLKAYSQAYNYAKTAAALNPDFYDAQLTLGALSLDKGQYKEAIVHYQVAQVIIARLPDMDNQHILGSIENQIGYAYEALRDLAQARIHYRLAMDSANKQDDDTAENDYQYAQDALVRIAKRTHH